MKLEKDEIQRIFLGALLVIGVLYGYFNFLLGPLKNQQIATRKATAELEPQIAQARETIAKSESATQREPKARETMAQIEALIPEGAPVAWFPPRVSEIFSAAALEKTTTRNTNEVPDRNLPGFHRMQWSVELAKIDYAQFVQALSRFENEEPLAQINTITIEANQDDPQTQRAVLSVSNLLKK